MKRGLSRRSWAGEEGGPRGQGRVVGEGGLSQGGDAVCCCWCDDWWREGVVVVVVELVS